MIGKDIPIECSIQDVNLEFLTLDSPPSWKIIRLAARMGEGHYGMLGEMFERECTLLNLGTVELYQNKLEYECERQKLMLIGERRGIFRSFLPFGYIRYSVINPEAHKPIGFLSPLGKEKMQMKIQDRNDELMLEVVDSVSKWELDDYYPFNYYEGRGPILHIHKMEVSFYHSLAQKLIREAIRKENPELVEIMFYPEAGGWLNYNTFWQRQLNFFVPPLEFGPYGQNRVAVWHPNIDKS